MQALEACLSLLLFLVCRQCTETNILRHESVLSKVSRLTMTAGIPHVHSTNIQLEGRM